MLRLIDFDIVIINEGSRMGTAATSLFDRVATLLADYCRHVDVRDAHSWADLFVEGGSFSVGDRRIEGAEALISFADGSPVGVHLSGQPSIEQSGSDIVVRSSWTFVRADGSQLLAGYYTDLVVDDGSTARFRERSVTTICVTNFSSNT